MALVDPGWQERKRSDRWRAARLALHADGLHHIGYHAHDGVGGALAAEMASHRVRHRHRSVRPKSVFTTATGSMVSVSRRESARPPRSGNPQRREVIGRHVVEAGPVFAPTPASFPSRISRPLLMTALIGHAERHRRVLHTGDPLHGRNAVAEQCLKASSHRGSAHRPARPSPVITFVASKPGGSDSRCASVRTSKPAPASSTNVSATSAPISHWRTRSRSAGHGPRPGGNGTAQIHAPRFQRRQRAKQQAGRDGDSERKRQHRPIQPESANGNHLVGQQLLHRREQRERQTHAGSAAGQRQHQILHPQLAQDSRRATRPAPCASPSPACGDGCAPASGRRGLRRRSAG